MEALSMVGEEIFFYCGTNSEVEANPYIGQVVTDTTPDEEHVSPTCPNRVDRPTFVSTASFVGTAAGDAQRQARHFKWGLKKWVLDRIVNTEYTNVAQVAAAARNIELLHESGNSNKRDRDGNRFQNRGQGQQENKGRHDQGQHEYRGRQDQSVEHRGRQDRGYDSRRQDFRGQDQRFTGRNGNDRQGQGNYNQRQHRGQSTRDFNQGHASGSASQRRSTETLPPPPLCTTCGKPHPGVCYKATGGCFTCGSTQHKVKDCPQAKQKQNMPTDFARLPPATGRVYATTRDQAAKTSGDPCYDHLKTYFEIARPTIENWPQHVWVPHVSIPPVVGNARELEEGVPRNHVELARVKQRQGSVHTVPRRALLEDESYFTSKACPKSQDLGFMNGINNPELIKRLKIAEKGLLTKQVQEQSWRHLNDRASSRNKLQQVRGAGGGTTSYTPLTMTPKEILATEGLFVQTSQGHTNGTTEGATARGENRILQIGSPAVVEPLTSDKMQRVTTSTDMYIVEEIAEILLETLLQRMRRLKYKTAFLIPEDDWKVEVLLRITPSSASWTIQENPDDYHAVVQKKTKLYSNFLHSAHDERSQSFNGKRGCLPLDIQAAEEAFLTQLKQHIAALPTLVAPRPGEELIMYLSVTHGAISAVLLTDRDSVQTPVYFGDSASSSLTRKEWNSLTHCVLNSQAEQRGGSSTEDLMAQTTHCSSTIVGYDIAGLFPVAARMLEIPYRGYIDYFTNGSRRKRSPQSQGESG
ncbi:zinc finger, CCHC-type, retrotransposon gag domain protein [Tanacetum coccineum]